MIELAEFAGVWCLSRTIDDQRANIRGEMHGTCKFLPETHGLRQVEMGVLRYGDAPPMQAERQYLWSNEAGQIVVQFSDGRPFHSFSPKNDAEADHLCGDDLYQVQYDFKNWPVWTSRWRVQGPRKDLIITSRFERDQ